MHTQRGLGGGNWPLESGLDSLPAAAEILRGPMHWALSRAKLRHGRVGVESAGQFEPSSYVGTFRHGASLNSLLRDEGLTLIPADELLVAPSIALVGARARHDRRGVPHRTTGLHPWGVDVAARPNGT